MKRLTVNGEAVAPASIEQEQRQLMADLKLQDQPLANDKVKLIIQDRARQNVIDHYLCKQEAKKRKLKVDPAIVEAQLQSLATRNGGMESVEKYLAEIGETFEDLRRHIEDRMLVDRLVADIHDGISRPKPRHAKKYYKEHKSEFVTPTTIEVRWFVKHFKSPSDRRKTLEEVQKIAQAVRGGKSFLTLVKQRSDEPAGDGLLGHVRKGDLAPEFDAFVFANESGAISDPIERDGTWYLLRNGEKTEGAQQEFDEVQEEIIELMWEEEKKETLKQLIEKLRSKGKIEEKEMD